MDSLLFIWNSFGGGILLPYIFENAVVHLPDFAIAMLAGYWLCGPKRRFFGVIAALLLLGSYAAGTFTAFGGVMAVLGALAGIAFATRKRVRAART